MVRRDFMPKPILVTGSSGLIGSEVAAYFAEIGWRVYGIDNNMRRHFFGASGDTRWSRDRLVAKFRNYSHYDVDVRNRAAVHQLVKAIRPEAIVHCAAQPSHDLAASRPFEDFDVNAGGTLDLLEAAREFCPESPFVHMSTNKVYGDAPNEIALVETETRWDYADPDYRSGIPETFRIDQSKHSLFGASKLAADILVQEYGRYFGIPTCCLRGGCLTGPNHTGVELHGFLSFLIRCNLERRKYRIYGYKGKQVRDNIHSLDVARFIDLVIKSPRIGEVYNIGGGRENSISIIEAFAMIEEISGKQMIYEYVEEPRSGDHICYISNYAKIKTHYPKWSITRDLRSIFDEIYSGWIQRLSLDDSTGSRLYVSAGSGTWNAVPGV
jgi:CDP-paratose 2-epimerase